MVAGIAEARRGDKAMKATRMLVAVLLAGTLAACGTNPVTGKKEIQFVSESAEIDIGNQNYAPMRQSEGGDVNVLPELSAYVNEVGQKLAAVSDRKLPYEFVVLNNSVPNAWCLPGGNPATTHRQAGQSRAHEVSGKHAYTPPARGAEHPGIRGIGQFPVFFRQNAVYGPGAGS